jgi:hypothetical protein
MIRVVIPPHLQRLAGVYTELKIDVEGPPTPRTVLDALEARYPMLRGTIRDYETGKRRPLLRFYACERDISHDSLDTSLPESVASGAEPFLVVASVAGG